MDQFAIAMSKKDCAVLLNSGTLEYRYLPFLSDKAEIFITNSLVKRALANSAYNDRRDECEKAFAVLGKKTGASSLCNVTTEQFNIIKMSLRQNHYAGHAMLFTKMTVC